MNDTGPFGGPLDGASPGLMVALTVRFLLELSLLAGVAMLAWRIVPAWWRWPAAIIAVAVVATVWGLFLSPKATFSLPAPAMLAVEAALFLGTGAGLFAVGISVPVVIGVVVWTIDRIALSLLQR